MWNRFEAASVIWMQHCSAVEVVAIKNQDIKPRKNKLLLQKCFSMANLSGIEHVGAGCLFLKNNKTPGYKRDIFPPPTLFKMHFSKEKLPFYMRSISLWLIFLYVKKISDFSNKTPIFGRKKEFFENMTILSAIYNKFAALSQFFGFWKSSLRTLFSFVFKYLTISFASNCNFSIIWLLHLRKQSQSSNFFRSVRTRTNC